MLARLPFFVSFLTDIFSASCTTSPEQYREPTEAEERGRQGEGSDPEKLANRTKNTETCPGSLGYADLSFVSLGLPFMSCTYGLRRSPGGAYMSKNGSVLSGPHAGRAYIYVGAAMEV